MCTVGGLGLLDLSKNKFFGSIPPCSNQSTLEILDLSQNNLTGNFPITWLNISHIYEMNIEENHLFGEIPNTTMNLKMLQTSKNQFGGPIPELCYFKHVQVLDLSHNNLSGQIPSCIFDKGDFTFTDFPFFPASRYEHLPSLHSSHYYLGVGHLNFSDANFILHVQYYLRWSNEESTNFGLEFMSKGRLDFYWERNLQLEYVIDLSSNKLVGHIPEDIDKMIGLITLNLSNNDLSGAIPNSLSNLHQLESLDLSHNSLTGEIPKELTKLTLLESFSVAYNDLSGSTLGIEAQFISFDNSSYEDNPNLCGYPLLKSCVPTLGTTQHSPNEDTYFLILFGSFSFFFVVSFWGSMVVLYFKRNWCCLPWWIGMVN
ncbi:receptor-like protein EIX2 [Carex rostrata]